MKNMNFACRMKKITAAACALAMITATVLPASAASKVPAKNPYAGYTDLDMNNFKKTADIYATDVTGSIDCTFENKVANASTLPRNKMGSFVVDIGSPALLYAEGKVSMNELQRVLLHSKKYIGYGKYKYIVTGIHDISKGITYNRGIHYTTSSHPSADSTGWYTTSGYTYDKVNIINNPNSVIKSIYAKGFINNPYSKTISYCDGYPCVKVKDGGSNATKGYVRALAFTLKKIS